MINYDSALGAEPDRAISSDRDQRTARNSDYQDPAGVSVHFDCISVNGYLMQFNQFSDYQTVDAAISSSSATEDFCYSLVLKEIQPSSYNGLFLY